MKKFFKGAVLALAAVMAFGVVSAKEASTSTKDEWGKYVYTDEMKEMLNSGEWDKIVIDVTGTPNGNWVSGTFWSDAISDNVTFSAEVKDGATEFVIDGTWKFGKNWSGEIDFPENPQITYADVYSDQETTVINKVTVIKEESTTGGDDVSTTGEGDGSTTESTASTASTAGSTASTAADKSNKTGDSTSVAILAVVALAALTGAVVMNRKQEN